LKIKFKEEFGENPMNVTLQLKETEGFEIFEFKKIVRFG